MSRAIAYVLALAFSVGGWWMYARTARELAIVQAVYEHDAQRAAADIQAKEDEREKRLKEAKDAATKREQTISAAAAVARGERDRLRDEIARRDAMPIDTAAAERESARRARAALEECDRVQQETAGRLDRRESEVRTLIEAWPR